MRTLLLAALLAVPVQAAEGEKPDVICQNGWCLVKHDTLKTLIEGLQKLSTHTTELHALCGWAK